MQKSDFKVLVVSARINVTATRQNFEIEVMAQKQLVNEREMIIEYWFRILCASSFSIGDIMKIIMAFGDEYETLDPTVSHKDFIIDDEKNIFIMKDHEVGGTRTGYGTIVANPGRIYHWKLRINKMVSEHTSYQRVNIGVIEASLATRKTQSTFWFTSNGYSYYNHSGDVYSGSFSKDGGSGGYSRERSKRYGDKYGENDVIDMWLDLKDNMTISWEKNGKKYDKIIKVKSDIEYKFALGTFPAEIELLLFEIIH